MFGWYMDVNLHRLTTVGLSAVTILILCSICSQTNVSGCSVSNATGELTANCSFLSLEEVPQNLSPNIQGLDISFNPIKELKSQNFERYKQLLVISYLNKDYATKIESTAFMGLSVLEALQLDGNDLSKNQVLFPLSIQLLTLSSTKLQQKYINLLALTHLKHLDIENNSFEYLPIMNKSTPLTLLYMKDNPLKKFSAKQLARFCHLAAFSINRNIDAFNDYPCECYRLKTWATDKKIILLDEKGNNFVCLSGLTCQDEEDVITPRMKELYNYCKANVSTDLSDDYSPISKVEKWFGRLVIVLIIANIFASLIAAFIYWENNNKSSPEVSSDQSTQADESSSSKSSATNVEEEEEKGE